MEQRPAVGRRRRQRRPTNVRLIGGYVSDELADQFTEICERQGITASAVVREHVASYVEAHRDLVIADSQLELELPMTG